MHRLPIAAALLAGLLIPASAGAQVTSSAEPNSTDAASRVTFGVDGTSPAFGSRVPSSLVLLFDRGFRVDLATPAICGDSAAQGGACAEGSQVASGRAVLETSVFGGAPTEMNAAIAVYKTQNPPLGAPAGTLAGLGALIRTENRKSYSTGYVTRTDDGPFGWAVHFDALQTESPFGYVTRLKRFDLDIAAHWTTPATVSRKIRCRAASKSRSCKRLKSCKRGKRCARYRTVREQRQIPHSLLRNPERCTGTWATRTIATFADGGRQTLDAPIACRAQ